MRPTLFVFALYCSVITAAVGICSAAQISGRVEAEDGRALASAAIIYSRRPSYPPGTTYRNVTRTRPLPGGEPFTRSIRPASDGRFVLPSLPPGVYDVCAFAETPYLSSCLWQPFLGVNLRSTAESVTLPPIVLKRGVVVRVQVDPAGHAVSTVQDKSAPQFNIGMLMPNGAYAAAEPSAGTGASIEFRVLVPPESTGKLLISSRQFELAISGSPGVILVPETALTSHIPVQLAPGEIERAFTLRISRRR